MTEPSADLDIPKYTGSADDGPVQDWFNLFELHATAASWSKREMVTNFSDYATAASAAQPGSTLDSSSPKMASASSQLNAVSHNHFAALATEDMDFCAGGNDTTTTDTINDEEVLRNTGRTAVAVRGNDLHPSDIAGWKISGKQNIIVISTPDEERARYYASVRSLYIGGRSYETHAYCTAPHDTVKGVIRGIAVENTAEDLHENIVNQANPQALKAHRIGNTTSIVILLAGTKVTNYIKYGCIIVKCGLYRQHHNVCKTCGKIGHRADLCPKPETKICFACGAPNPTADHAARCRPRCKLCNEAHATGTEACTNKYKVPFVFTQRRWERRNAASTFSSQDFPQLPPQQQNEAHLSKRGRSRSRKRDKSRRQLASRGRSSDGKRSEDMNYNRNQQRPGNVINGAQAVNLQAANRNPLNHVAEAMDNTIQSLRNQNDQLKRCIAEQRAQMQEMNAKLNQLINAQQQQQQQQVTPPPPLSSPQSQPRPPTPTENNTNSAMEVQVPVTTEANSAEPETIDVAKTSEPSYYKSQVQVQVPVTTEANSAEPETIDVARTSEQAPKKRVLEYARERRVNARLDSLEERQD
ncbi:hypothetical protein HPB51_021054 [Rhipicephalus microplus]|uniref:CCHC-type domain-containing protein n=1 Tax=Rhipicephalus microplus TaxID=6941 RepID=A0A9J6EC61_RHIMP|nr:hypothetical protein HPB51_021054 [Rhipicephalus microplus]